MLFVLGRLAKSKLVFLSAKPAGHATLTVRQVPGSKTEFNPRARSVVCAVVVAVAVAIVVVLVVVVCAHRLQQLCCE